MNTRGTVTVATLLAALPRPALAQSLHDAVNSGDTAWLLAAAALVLLAALPGIALLHSGRLRAGNGMSVLFQTLAIVAVVSLIWTVVGYTLAFGDVSGGWIGAGNAWMLIRLSAVRAGTAIPESAFVLFQLVAATLAPVLMTGAWAERARFGWVVLFCALWSLMAAAPISHWVMGGGWLASSVGTLDWSGGLPIFVATGASSLVVAVMMGRRLDYPGERDGNGGIPLRLAGSALVWIGGIGLCGGWALAASDAAAAAAINAHVAMAASVFTWFAADRLSHGRIGSSGLGSSVLAGLAAVAPAAGYISPGAALVLGILGALAARQGLRLLARARIDDTLGIFAIAGLPAMIGTLLLGLFLSPSFGGTGYARGHTMISQIFAQAVGLGAVVLWAAVASTIAALMASVLFPMRMSEHAERNGLDFSSHGIGPAT
ncbi:Amt family ammonium transporter [Novosphingobium sp. PhB165]|uniref:ammonium transporter n=1 Tax=Novosphingobium sp. PhB165 TaxID=2485105 RepID=UPI001042CDDF|nr:ammonium transporter [Novosphingobium sp. PhB165]TCM22238.1 Amt family ammonium transporter [Novosphingobium sp. PhB165]